MLPMSANWCRGGAGSQRRKTPVGMAMAAGRNVAGSARDCAREAVWRPAGMNRPAHKQRKEMKASIDLTHGSLLIIRGGTQANWLHQIPKTARQVEERLNLTFRAIVAPAQ